MPYQVNAVTWLATRNGIPVSELVYQDPANNLAIPNTNYVISASGLLLPAPVDANNVPMVSASITGSLANIPTVTIANGAALSGTIDLLSQSIVGLSIPSIWTAASITFAVSSNNLTFNPLYYQGAEFTLPEASASRQITIDPTALLPWRYVKVRSGTNGTPVNQGQSTIITLLTKPIA